MSGLTDHCECGADYRHPPHHWLEIDAGERIQHWCSGEPDPDDVMIDEQDELYERGGY